MPTSPTYRTETNDQGQTVYVCLYCEEQAAEHHSSDEELFLQHMEQRHDGRMVEDTEASAKVQSSPPDHPHGGPPGQTGEHPEHPHGGPPGQTGEHPQGGPPGQGHPPEPGDIPEPTHPIVMPDEEPTPEERP